MLNDIFIVFSSKRHVTPWIWCWTSKWNLSNIYTSAHYTWEPLTTLHEFVPVLGRPLNTSSGSWHFHGHCSRTCMRDSRSSSSARTRREQEIHRNSIWLGAQSHMTSQYIWQPPTILHDSVSVLGRPLKFFLGCYWHGHGSRLFLWERHSHGPYWRVI